MPLGTNFLVGFFSFQMADEQGHIVEQGAEDPANNDTVDAKPDRSSFVSSIFR